MDNYFFLAVEIAATLTECFLSLLFNVRILKDNPYRLEFWKTFLSALVLMAIIQVVNFYPLFSIIASLISIAGIAAVSALLYRCSFRDAAVTTIISVMLIHAIDFLLISMMSILLQMPDFGKIITSGYSILRASYLLISRPVLIILYCLIIKRIAAYVRRSFRKLTGGVIVCFFFIWYYSTLTLEQAGTPTLFIWVSVLLVILGGSYLFSELISWKNAQNDYQSAIRHNQDIARSYHELCDAFQQRNSFYHDMNNQYLAIKGYLDRGEYQKAQDYIRQIHIPSANSFQQWSGIDVLDLLFAYKLHEVQKNDIQMELACDRISLPLSDQECISLFGNALDNAIEACKTVDSGTRWIKVILKQIQEMTYIRISNSYTCVKYNREGKLVSTKSDSFLHGIGMKGMELIVNQHGGLISAIPDTENGFTLEISFFHQTKDSSPLSQ